MLIDGISQKCNKFFFSIFDLMFVRDCRLFFLPPSPQSQFFKLWENVSFKNATFVFFESQCSLSEISIGALNFFPSQYSNSYWCVTTSSISSISRSQTTIQLWWKEIQAKKIYFELCVGFLFVRKFQKS